ncbi:MAG: M48 family metalloprotease [Oscillospiraceae bacterium]|jgi:heat shock protein HtpX|nr:M48 family metalloprotease [Oscillospiraceae bacterium]
MKLMASTKRRKTWTIIGIITLIFGVLLLGGGVIAHIPVMRIGLVSLVVMLIGVIIIVVSHKKVKEPAEQPVEPQRKPKAQVAPKAKPARTKGNGAYVVWYLFYLFLFLPLFPIYSITTIIAFSPLAEKLWRRVSGIRPLRLKSEKDRLHPLFHEVYMGAYNANPGFRSIINIYIKEDMSINAFAFGKSTLVLTRGSIELLNDDCLKGLLAHELGHFAHHDTEAVLLMAVSNFFMSLFFGKLTDCVNCHDSGFLVGVVKVLFYYPLKVINFIGELILMRKSRQNEYLADIFALGSGFGKELNGALIELYGVSIEKPQSVKEQFKATHPHITLRIEQLEKIIYFNPPSIT